MKNLLHVWMVLFLCGSFSAVASASEKLQQLKREAVDELEGMRTLTRQMVDMIFSFSELGFQELETSAYITSILRQNGFEVNGRRLRNAHCLGGSLGKGSSRHRLWERYRLHSQGVPKAGSRLS